MSVDILQERIRKTKNPSVVELSLSKAELPPHLLAEEGTTAKAYTRFGTELLNALKGTVPAVRFSFASFALLGSDGLQVLHDVMLVARELKYYILLDAPEILSPKSAAMTAEAIWGEETAYPCDGLVISGYLGSDIIKPFLKYCEEGKKDLFVVARTANKSAPELQDLLAGGRLVHAAAADHVNRYGKETAGKYGYTRVGIVGAASAADSLRNLRSKYPKLFFLVDGYDYPNSNAKNCSFAFDKFGHGAVVCCGSGITCAWKEAEGSDGRDYTDHAVAAAERMKKNLTRYITVM